MIKIGGIRWQGCKGVLLASLLAGMPLHGEEPGLEAETDAPVLDLSGSVLLSTTTHQTGERRVIMHRITDPGLPVTPSKKAAPESGDRKPVSIVTPRPAAVHLPALSATVYEAADGTAMSHVRWTVDGASSEAWSNIDFRRFRGTTTVQIDGQPTPFIMAITEAGQNAPATADKTRAMRRARAALPAYPAYTLDSEAPEAEPGLLDVLHDLFEAELPLLLQREARWVAAAEQAAERKQQQSQQDTVIYVWRRDLTGAQGGERNPEE